MSTAATNSAGGGLGCFTILGLIFVTLKLAEIGVVASWPWIWVLAPFWGPLALVVVVFLLAMAGGSIVYVYKKIDKSIGS